MSARVLLLCAALAASGAADAQQVNTYTQTETGPNLLPYGLPVPMPIESLTPVDGFRSYASLEARLQGLALASPELAAHDVGRTFNNRTLWAYVVSDEDGVDVEGRPEAAFFINATTHAREWGAPEVSTGTIERLLAGGSDAGLVRYLLDNTRLVIIPVHNIDGLQQTQRFPTQVIIGQDPDVPTWPRDGRMRRKNMRGVDENLLTFADHLGGIDLNRNHPPFWATAVGQGGSSANPNSLTFHGGAPHSEPENQALRSAAQLGPATRFRLGIDVHSFSRVFFSSNTARTRLNNVQANLIGRMRAHHLQLSGADYANVPDPANRGIGAAAEYFAYEWLVPSWTLELEPRDSPVEYGGLDVNHGGFILPASQARRVRESWAETHAIGFYMMSGPPHLKRVRVFDADSDALVFESRWQFDPVTARRTRVTSPSGALRRGARYRAELGFSKPMRHRDAQGAIAPLPGIGGVSLSPSATLLRDAGNLALDTSAGEWLTEAARVLRYRDDTFAFDFTAPDASADFSLEVGASDMTGLQLDADASTPADWSSGAWAEWENAAGFDGDIGGADRSTTLRFEVAAASQVSVLPDARVLGEGDIVALRVERALASTERVELYQLAQNGDLAPPTLVATWLAGEGGERSIPIAAGDDLVARGDATFDVVLEERVDGVLRGQTTVRYRLLDNDTATASVLRYRNRLAGVPEQGQFDLSDVWTALDQPTEFVLDHDVSLHYPRRSAEGAALEPVSTSLQIHGGSLVFGPSTTASTMRIQPGAELRLDRVNVIAEVPGGGAPLIRNDGSLRLSRTIQTEDDSSSRPFVYNTGQVDVEYSAFNLAHEGSLFESLRGTVNVRDSSFIGVVSRESLLIAHAGSIDVRRTTLVGNDTGYPLLGGGEGLTEISHSLLQRNVANTTPSPPGATCGSTVRSLGYNLYDGTDCPFDAPGDQRNVTLNVPSILSGVTAVNPTGTAIDTGTGGAECVGIDQRGAPRPQARVAGATPRCDIGAIELGINPYRGIWQPERDGHGVELHTSGNQLLLVWYTYADDGQPTSYQAIAPLTGPHWEADLLQPRRDPQTGIVTTPRVGRVTLDFANDTDAQLGWRFDARATTGTERLRPATFAIGEPRFEVTGVWYPPAEAGYGATITRRGETTAVVLYYYDASGNVRWVLGAGNGADGLDLEMSSFTGFCPDCSAAAMPLVSQAGGRLLVHFQTPRRARLDTQLAYPGSAGGTWNRVQAVLAPLNDPVDNRPPSE